jgi:hypothetical protein
MKNLLLFGKLLAGLVLALFIGAAIGGATGLNPLAIGAAVFAAQLVRACVNPAHEVGAGFAFDDPLTTIFTRELQRLLFPNNAFYRQSVLIGTGAEVSGRYFNIPQEIETPGFVTNPTSFPLTVEEMSDDSETVEMDLHATKPTRLGDREALEVAFDRRASILGRHASVLELLCANTAINRWSAIDAVNAVVRTSGAAVSASLPGQTGTRKVITKDDFINANQILDRTNMQGQRYALVGATMYSDLLRISDFVDYQKTGNTSALLTGALGELFGIKFFKRSTAAIYTSALLPKAVGAALTATDQEGALLWIDGAVGRVEGAVQTYINAGRAEYLGDIMNAAVRFGCSLMRQDKAGIVGIIQSNG